MKTTLLMIMAAGQFMAADPISEALQKGLFEEEANHNLEAAIKAYERVIEQSQEQRRMAATALFRLGECYRKLGRTNDATAQYQRLLREFPEQSTLANLSQQNIRALGVGATGDGVTQGATSNLFDTTGAERSEIERIKAIIKNSPDLINGRG